MLFLSNIRSLLWGIVFSIICHGVQAKDLVVGICADSPPFSMQEKGAFIGFEIDLVKSLAQKLHQTVVFKDMDFAALIPAVLSARVDCAVAAIVPTPEREKSVSFSLPYYRDRLVMLSLQDHDAQHPFQGLKTLGVQLGTNHMSYLESLKSKDPTLIAHVKTYNRIGDMVQDLQTGRIQGIILERSHAGPLHKKLGFTLTLLPESQGGFSVLLPKDASLKASINKAIKELQEDGTIERLEKKWILKAEAPTQENTFWENALFILGGIKVTLFYTLFSLLGGAVLGLGLVLMRVSRFPIVSALAAAYVSVFRGIPLLLQLWLIYFGTGNYLAVWQAGLLAFSLNSAAYLSEIMRAGIQSIDRGQWDAGYVLGIPRWRILKDIIFPQALRRQLPAFVNEAADLLKESALVSVITEADLMRRANVIAAQNYDYWTPYLIAGACYYTMVCCLSFLAKSLEKHLAGGQSS